MMLAENKPRVAVFKFTGCAGCQMELLRLEDELLDIVEKIDVVYFMMAQSKEDMGPYDICFVEGSVSTPRELEELKKIRASSKVLVALGDCAIAGCIPSIRNYMSQSEAEEIVYDNITPIRSFRVRGIGEYVPVDINLPGCPPHKNLIYETITAALQGILPDIKHHSVCVDCKLKENVCLLTSLGRACMGPVTKAGCGAICPSVGRVCEGCYGPMSDANPDELAKVFRRAGLSEEDVVRKFRKYAGITEEFRKEAQI
jgi:coenzyme F420-reducing hydrogenase gamma subunit